MRFNIQGDRIRLDRNFFPGSFSVYVNSKKLGSWPVRKNASYKAKIGERDYLITSTKISKRSASILLQIDIFENGISIHSGRYDQYGTPVANIMVVGELDSARVRWGFYFGALGAGLGAFVAMRMVQSPDFMLDAYSGAIVGGLLGAVGGLVGFMAGHCLEVFLQRLARPIAPAQAPPLPNSGINASSVPTLQVRPREVEGGSDQTTDGSASILESEKTAESESEE